MGISDIVSVSVLIAGSASPTRQGFGTPMLAAYFTSGSHWQGSGDRIRFYPSSSALVQLVADGFSTSGVVFRAMSVACSQNPCPPLIALGRRALPFTQILKLKCLSVTAGDIYRVTVEGTDGVQHTYTLTSTGTPATDAATFAALMTASLIGTITVSTDTITLTQVAGSLSDLQNWSPFFAISDTTVDPGLAADLTAITAANSLGWYGLALDSNSDQEVLAAASFVEATGQGGKFGFFNSPATANVTTGSGDLNSTLQSLTRVKSFLTQSNRQVLACTGIGLASLLLAFNPGSYSAAFKSVAGVLADTDQTMTETQQLILNTASTSQPGTGGKGGNWYKTVSGLNITFPGVTPGGRWMDQTIFADWLQNNMQADIFAVFAGLPKVPLTDIGIGLVGAAIKSRLKIGGSAPFNGIDLSRGITVTLPTAATMSTTDRNNRNLSGVSATFFFTGAINSTELVITGTP